MNKPTTLAASFCAASTVRADLSPGAIRVATWIIGASILTGDYPIELTVLDIMHGFTRNGVEVAGTNAHRNTVNAAFSQLEECGYLNRAPGTTRRGGWLASVCTFTLPAQAVAA